MIAIDWSVCCISTQMGIEQINFNLLIAMLIKYAKESNLNYF